MPTQRSDEAVSEDNDYRANQVARINSTNADIIRERYLDAIEEGEWTIIPVQHKAGTKELTSVQS